MDIQVCKQKTTYHCILIFVSDCSIPELASLLIPKPEENCDSMPPEMSLYYTLLLLTPSSWYALCSFEVKGVQCKVEWLRCKW